jgi:4-amino-4-deoxy-L-arabinose transferase-like glycosyltransferase
MRRNRDSYPLWFALLFASLPLLGWWMTGLFDLDEGFYGAVVSEMNRRGEWVTPYYNGEHWFEKPILLYWLAKPCFALFGTWLGARLPSVLCTVGLYAAVGAFARKRLGVEGQLRVIYCLGSSLLVLVLGRLMMTDAPLNLALTVAFLSFYESIVTDKRWRLLTGFCLGVAILAKGPVALLLFAPIATLTYWRQPDLRAGFKGLWTASFAVLILVVAIWYVPCYLINRDEFVQKFLIEQNLDRFTGGDKAHSLGIAGLPFYIPILLVAVAPWGWIEWRAFTRSNVQDSYSRYLLTWAATILVFFTISSAKLPHYILPAIAPMALLVAKKMMEKPVVKWSSPLFPICTGIVLLVGLLDPLQRIWYRKSGQAEAHQMCLKHPEIGAFYRLSRQDADLSTGTTNLQETSLPSLIMLLNKTVLDVDDEKLIQSKIAQSKLPIVILTRANRKVPSTWKPVETGQNYTVYRAE